MASIDEAYLDMTGTERLLGPPLAAAHKLHEAVKRETGLNCSIGIASSRLVAKVASDQAKPNGVLWVLPGREARWLAPLDVRKIPGVGKVTEQHLHAYGIRKVGDLARLEESFLEKHFGKWGLAPWPASLAARTPAAGSTATSATRKIPSPSATSTPSTGTRRTSNVLESTLARLSEMVGRRLREHALHARTVQLKLRYKDFSTITRARTLARTTQLDTELYREVRALFEKNWNRKAVRLLGVQAASLERLQGQMSLLEPEQGERWRKALSAADQMRDRYGESAVSLAAGLKGGFRERVHENPASLPGKHPK